MAYVIGRGRSWLAWLVGCILALVFGSDGRASERAQLKYGIARRPLQPVSTVTPSPLPTIRPSGSDAPWPRDAGEMPMPRPPVVNPRGGIRQPRGVVALPTQPPPPPPPTVDERVSSLLEGCLDPDMSDEQRQAAASMIKDMGRPGQAAFERALEQARTETRERGAEVRREPTAAARTAYRRAAERWRTLHRMRRWIAPAKVETSDEVRVKPLRERVVDPD